MFDEKSRNNRTTNPHNSPNNKSLVTNLNNLDSKNTQKNKNKNSKDHQNIF